MSTVAWTIVLIAAALVIECAILLRRSRSGRLLPMEARDVADQPSITCMDITRPREGAPIDELETTEGGTADRRWRSAGRPDR